MTEQDQRPLSTLVAQGWEIVSYASGMDGKYGAVADHILLRRQKAHKILTIRNKMFGHGYVVTERDV